ncbi:MAG: DNA alkylation repair protein [Nanoarchaeota archaeon]|nr:DNA alkylation repair protein [Nanoarchaeota archaeon]
MKINILSDIRKELKKHIDINYKDGSYRLFKEKVKIMGVRTHIVRKLSKKYFNEIKHLDKKQIFSLCEQLLKSGYSEESIIAFDWSFRLREQYKKSDFKIFERWLNKYVSDWGKCDNFCTHTIHHFITKFPEFVPKVKSWSKSKNRWVRRASAVSFITTDKSYYVVNHNLNDVFDVAKTLLEDKDDLVQKGYGWMLKAASVSKQKEVFDFVMKHKDKMPRTALRYAIEHMPDKMRKEAMKVIK